MKKSIRPLRVLPLLAAVLLGCAAGTLLRTIYLLSDSMTAFGIGLGLLLTLGCVFLTSWDRGRQDAYVREQQRRDALARMWARVRRRSDCIEEQLVALGDGDEYRDARLELRDEQAALWQAAEEAEQGDRDPYTVAVNGDSGLNLRVARPAARSAGGTAPRLHLEKPAPAHLTPAGAASTSEGPQFLQPILIPLVTNAPSGTAGTSDNHCADHDHTSSGTSDSGCSSSDSPSSDSGG